MYEAERREAMLLFDMAGILKKAAEEINTLALRCDEYAKSYDALDDDYEGIKEKYDKLYEEKCYLEAKIKKAEKGEK